jgi:hypothetical protein
MKFGFDLRRLKKQVKRAVSFEQIAPHYSAFSRLRTIDWKIELHVQQFVHDF